MTATSSIFPIYIKSTYQDSQGFARFQSDAQRAANVAKKEFIGVAAAVDNALARDRTGTGSLDLGVNELRDAAAAQQARAIAAREVAEATLRAAMAEGRFNVEMRSGVVASRNFAKEQERLSTELVEQLRLNELVQKELAQTSSATNMVAEATSRAGRASRIASNDNRASRTAFIQLGQQMQDMTIQAQLGTNAFTIFSQQVPQAAFALSGLSRSANATQAKIGNLAAFFAGPWGAAIFAGTAILGPFVAKLFEASDALEDAEFASNAFADAQSILGGVIDLQTGKIKDQSDALLALAKAQAVAGEFAARRRAAEAREQIGDLQDARFRRNVTVDASGGSETIRKARERAGLSPTRLEPFSLSVDPNLESISKRVLAEEIDFSQAIDELKALQVAGQLTEDTMLSAAESIANLGVEIGNIDKFTELQKALAGDQDAVKQFLKPDRAKSPKPGIDKDARDAQRDYEQSLKQASQFAAGLREQEALLGKSRAEVNAYKVELEALAAEQAALKAPTEEGAKALRDQADAIRKAGEALAKGELKQAIADLVADSDRRLKIEGLLLAGREDEVAVMEAIARLEQNNTKLTKEQREEVERTVLAERQRLEIVDRLREQQDAYLSATQSVRQELENLFAGEGADFEKIFKRLRARLTVEALFGDGLRQLEKDVKSSFDVTVDKLETNTVRASDTMASFADAAISAIERINNAASLVNAKFVEGPTIDLSNRPVLNNGDGSFSTIETVSFANEFGEVVVPTIINGVRVGVDEAIKHYEQTGEHLGVFANAEEAARYAKALSEAQAQTIEGFSTGADRATRLMLDLAVAAGRAEQEIKHSNSSPASETSSLPPPIFDADGNMILTGPRPANDNVEDGVRKATEDTAMGMTPERFAKMQSEAIVDPLLKGLPPQLAGVLGPVLKGALAGQFLAGNAGAIFGGLNGLFGKGSAIGGKNGLSLFGAEDIFGSMFSGAQQGAQTDAILDLLGIKSSGTGAAAGGAIGAAVGSIIPGVGTAIGSVVGSIAGGLIGGVLKGTPRGSALIGNTGGELGITGYYGTSSSRKDAAGELAGSVLDTIDRIASQIGGTVDASKGAVSVGIRDDNYRLDKTGQGITKTKNGAIDFGSDAEGLVRAAVLDLIQDGVIGGISAAEQRLLQAGDDLEKALTDVLTFRSVFDRLKQFKDPLGFALDELNDEFQQLVDLFDRAGASAEQYADLEELYSIERTKLIEQETDRLAGSLKDLVNDLLTGANGLSLRDRRANALNEYDALKARVEAGDTTALDDFAEASRTLLDIERQLFGSQQGYFDRFDEVLAISQSVLAEQDRLAQAALAAGTPFDGTSPVSGLNLTLVTDSVDRLGDRIVEEVGREITSRLDAVNRNLGDLSQSSGSRFVATGEETFAKVANYF